MQTFKDVKNVIIHAVGGGGAGGQISDDFVTSLEYKTVQGLFDVRVGQNFPNKILNYTTSLATNVLVPMPSWFNWGTFTNNLTGKNMELVAVACGDTGELRGSAGKNRFVCPYTTGILRG